MQPFKPRYRGAERARRRRFSAAFGDAAHDGGRHLRNIRRNDNPCCPSQLGVAYQLSLSTGTDGDRDERHDRWQAGASLAEGASALSRCKRTARFAATADAVALQRSAAGHAAVSSRQRRIESRFRGDYDFLRDWAFGDGEFDSANPRTWDDVTPGSSRLSRRRRLYSCRRHWRDIVSQAYFAQAESRQRRSDDAVR